MADTDRSNSVRDSMGALSDDQDFDDDLPTSPTIDEEEASYLIMSDDAGRVYAPPAHLAARFYRASATRRKSSATSSRRNSLSSTHSHGSSRSLRRTSGSQTHSVAHHLRRASILESRKARLADRAAHAEQVRVRAALAKAAPRGNATNSEERALAAQIAREKYLAKVTAACAEEVQKAKQKAQEMKARKLEEEKRVRQDMEERLAEADKRRAEYQRNLYARRLRRASSQEKKLAVVAEDSDADADLLKPTETTIDDETAARRIQRTWRTRQRRTIVDAYLDLDFTIDGLRNKSFEQVGSLVADSRIIKATSGILRLLDLSASDGASNATCSRSFLSAYLIVSHPASVLSKQGTQEQDLMLKSREVITLFESAVCRLAVWNRFCPSLTHCEELGQVYATYLAAFEAWKAQDASALIETMVASFVELDAIWQSVRDDVSGYVANDYREGVRDNQVILLSKIRKLAGPDRADFLIKKAIRESRRRRGRRRTAAEVRPRVADDGQTAGGETVTPDIALPQESTPAHDTSADARSFGALFSPIPSNRVLTHELAINSEFRIPTSAHSHARDMLNRKLCDSMQKGVEQGEGAVWTTAMAECIRGKLLGILKPGNSMHTLISEAMDTDHVYRQSTQGLFSYAKFFDFMASVLPKLCAPFRDAEVKALADDLQSATDDTSAMIEKLFRLLHFIDLLSLDYSNFLLMSAAPVLIRESAGYEQRMFAQDVETGTRTLQGAKRWWRNASVNLLTEADGRDPEQIRLLADRPTPRKIYYRGLVDLALSQSQRSDEDWPETLHLDKDRLEDMRIKCLSVVAIGASLLTAKNLLKRDVRSPWKTEANRLWDIVAKDGLDNEDLAQKVFNVISSAHNMPQATQDTLQGAYGRFFGQAASGRLVDPIVKVLYQRLKGHIYRRVSATSSQERVRAASTASEGLANAGLPEFAAHVSEMVDLLSRISEVDWKSHGSWYEELARDVQGAED